jgi:streptogramin lyase
VTVAGAGAVAIAVDPHGNPWIVNSGHKIFRRSGSKWVAVSGAATGISVGANGSVWAVGTANVSGGHPVIRWTGTTWVTVAGAGAVAIAVDPHGNPWIVNSGHKISRRSGSKWVALPGAATDIAVGANGTVWDVATDTATGGHTVYRWSGSAWIRSSGAAVKIAVDQHGNPWIVNSSHKVYFG